eukprot:9372844-Lingulodinium_polyedra.AAC.1
MDLIDRGRLAKVLGFSARWRARTRGRLREREGLLRGIKGHLEEGGRAFLRHPGFSSGVHY